MKKQDKDSIDPKSRSLSPQKDEKAQVVGAPASSLFMPQKTDERSYGIKSQAIKNNITKSVITQS
jgi:hypothetical protein